MLDNEMPNQNGTIATLLIAVLWIGSIIGLSVIATPAKFLAPSLDLPTALDVGKHTFNVFIKYEWVLLFVLVAALSRCKKVALSLASSISLFVIVLMQSFWLLPALNERVDLMLSGSTELPESYSHMSYVLLELAKLVVLIFISWRMVAHIKRESQNTTPNNINRS